MCANPTCKRWADHAHHIFRRTDQRLGQAYNWVEIKGEMRQNKCALCADCHDAVTGPIGGHKAAIRILGPDYDWVWTWCEVRRDSQGEEILASIGPLRYQPMTPEQLAAKRDSDLVPELESCPTCGHVKRARSGSSGAGRARATWTVKVPADAEDGAEILDVLVDDMALILGVEPNMTGRYYVILPCLYYAHQEKARFVDSLKGIGG